MGVGASRDPDVSGDPTSFAPLLEDDALLESGGGQDAQMSNLASTIQQQTYAAISPQDVCPPPREMHPFWVPPLEERVYSNRHYRLINVPNHPRPKNGLRAPRPFVIYDFILSALVLTIAMQLIHPSRAEQVSWQAIIGAVLFQAGLVTAVMIIYAIFRSCGRRLFRWEDILTVIAIGLSLCLTRTTKNPWRLPAMLETGTWQLFVGISLLEAVAIYMLSRGMFLLSTKDDTIDMLMVEVDSLQTSIAVGLSEAYFDRVRKVGQIISRGRGHVRVSYQNPVESRDSEAPLIDDMYVPCIFITIPRHVDWREVSPTLQTKTNYIRSGRLLTCRVEGSGDFGAPWLCVTGIRQGYVLDVSPSPLQRIIDDIRANPKFSNNQKRTLQYQKEIHRFSHRLAWLVMRARLEDHVKILEFEDEIMPYIPSACNEVMSGLPNLALGLDDEIQSPLDAEAGQLETETGG